MRTRGLKPSTGWVAARVVLVECAEVPGRPGSAIGPAYDDNDWMGDCPTLKRVEDVNVCGIVAFTWEDDPASDEDLIARSTALVDAAARRALRRLPA